ncbi:MAG: hypothetical protein KKF89_03850, partial [Nanoarchaeota archaeon]|nr:hypothetical protein [Nanoarchaeota archaeon]
SKNDIGYDLNNYVNYYYDDLGRKIIREDFFNVTFIYYYLSGEVLFETSFEKCSFEPKSPGIRIQKGEDVLAYIDGSGGVLLKGDLFQQQTIPTDIDGFAIEDSVGKKIALFDNQGNLHLAGSYIPFVGLSRSSDKEFVVRSPDVFGTVNDVLIIDNTGNLRTILCVRSNTEFSLT